MNGIRLMILLLIAGTAVSAFAARRVVETLESDLPATAVPLEWVEATVNKQVIPSGDVDEMLQAYLRERNVERLDDMVYQEARTAVLEQMINDALIVQEARRMELTVRKDVLDAAVEAELRRQQRRFSQPAQFEEELRARGSTLATWKFELREQLEEQFLSESFLKTVAVRGSSVTDAEVQQYVETNPQAAEKYERVLLRHILLSLPPNAPADDVSRRTEEMRQIAGRIQSGESFAEVAREVSEDAETRERDGNLGYYQRGEWPEAGAAFDLEPGDLFGPIRDDKGLHIVQLLQKYTVRDFLLFQKRREALRSYLADLREAAEIDIKLKPFALYRAERARIHNALR